jgi:hypothetical protein
VSPTLQTQIVQEDFSAGMSRDVAPPLISRSGAFDMANALLDEDGSVYRRGGSIYKSTNGLGNSGLWMLADVYLKPGLRTLVASDEDFGALAADDTTLVNIGGTGVDEPKQFAVLDDILFLGGGVLYGGSLKSGPYSEGTISVTNGSTAVLGTGTDWTTSVDAGMLLQIGSERVYVVQSVNSATSLTLGDPYEGATGSGKTYSANTIYQATLGDPYEEWEYVATCANRLVLASGNKIRFTEINKPWTFVNSLGTVNEHTLPEGTRIVGLATVGQTLLVFTTGGIWTIEGLALDIVDLNGNNQHRIQVLSTEVVLASAPGLAGAGQMLIVPATDGVFLMDGVSQPQRISRPIDRLYRRRISDGYVFGQAVVYRNHYFLPILGERDVRDCLVCRVDRPISDRRQRIYPWSRFDGDAGETRAFAVRNTIGPREPFLLGAQARTPSRIVDCSGFFEPSTENEADADGSVHELDIITRDIETGGGTENVVRELVVRRELVGDQGPVLKVYRSAGSTDAGGDGVWDEATWDVSSWAPEESSVSFTSLESDIPVGDERHIHKCPVNKRQRYARFRLRSVGPASYCAIRSLALRVRPSQATRR